MMNPTTIKPQRVFKRTPDGVEYAPQRSSLPRSVKRRVLRKKDYLSQPNPFIGEAVDASPIINRIKSRKKALLPFSHGFALILFHGVNPSSTTARAERIILKSQYLKKGWDTYDAGPPSSLAIRTALKIVRSISSAGLIIDWVVPTSEESLLIQASDALGRLLKFEIESDGDIAAMVKFRNGEPTFHDLTLDSVETFLKRVLADD